MRIVSDFKDYYDCISATDREKTPVFVRNRVRGVYENCPFPTNGSFIKYYYGRSWNCDEVTIGFCGKIYPLLIFSNYSTGLTARCRSLEQVDGFFNALGGKDLREYLEQDRVTRRKWRRKFKLTSPGCRSGFEEYFNNMEKGSSSYLKWFEDRRCPVFVGRQEGYNNYVVEWNANLRLVEFYRVFPPEQAYQNIRMFLDNLAVPLPNVPPVSDKQMAEIKGFDKFSFRKDPIRRKR